MSGEESVTDLLVRWEELREAGTDLSAEQLCRDRPDLVTAVAEGIRKLKAAAALRDPSLADGPWPTADPWCCPAVPGYEVLEELGHGGMSVVYKARQVKLKRLVALKMIRAAGLAGPEQRARFRREAEAVARLQHPHIIQIHEIGEHAGLPYLALELADGGSLARRLAERLPPAREAAALIETLARAMHYAHQRGIVHRDLKPANVLLTTDGVPKVADFGLAKLLEGEPGQTQTQSGAVLGTPCYMAPEQAAGRVHDVGPRTDVYALGAILYELLTGRPPFRGDSTLEVLERVRRGEPEPPRRLQPRLPRDLETVCLKALAQEPARRYTSALALAQDLERFRAGESILARPAGFARKALRKLRRHALAAAPAALLLLAAGAAVVAALTHRNLRATERLGQQIEAALDADLTTAEQLDRADALVTDLGRLAPDKAAEYRAKVNHRLAGSIEKVLTRPDRLLPEDRGRVEALLPLLEARAPDLAGPLRQRRDERLQDWEMVVELRGPSLAGWEQVFPSGQVVAQEDRLVSTRGVAEPLLTQAPCRGDVELEAEFAGSWDPAAKLGLVLYGVPDGTLLRGYQFRLSLPTEPDPRSPVLPALAMRTIAEAQEAGRVLELEILRDETRQREACRIVKPGNVCLRAVRRGDQLTFQVNDTDPVLFRDLTPFSRETGTFGLVWPRGARLLRLVARQAPPPVATPLEQGDELYTHGRYRDALDSYLRQAETAGVDRESRRVRHEARCKAALCRLRLNQPAEASPLFEQVAGEAPEPGEPWPLLAAYYLLLLYARAGDLDRADHVFATRIQSRERDATEPAALVPDDLRNEIANTYYYSPGDPADPRVVRHRECCVALCDLFRLRTRLSARLALLRAYWWSGREDLALETARESWDLCRPLEATPVHDCAWVLDYYSWLLRRRGEPGRALEAVNRGLTGTATVYRELPACAAGIAGFLAAPRGLGPLLAVPVVIARTDKPVDPSASALRMLLERARVYTALGNWDRAGADLELLFRLGLDEQLSYPVLCRACLLQGFLRERRGDGAGARAAWRRGLYPGWAARVDPERRRQDFADMEERFHHVLLASLAGELTEADARLLWGTSDVPAQDAKFCRELVSASVLRTVAATPRGREAARRYAFLDLSLPEYGRLPAVLMLAAVFQEGLPAPVPPEQEELLWETAGRCVAAADTGRVTRWQYAPLLLAFEGVSGPFGWQAAAGSLDPDLRGRLAYVLGQRYLRVLKRPEKEVLPFFRTARDDAPPDSALRRLALAELERLTAP